MRFIHTGDWHLGRQLHRRSLIEDQMWWLDRFVELVAAEKPDAVIIAGDVYDRSVPPAEAVALLDDVLTRIVRGLGTPVALVAGNHDGPERVGFASRVLDEAGLFVAGRVEEDVRSFVLGEGADATRVWLLPYADPIETRCALGDDAVHDHEAAVAASIERVRAAAATEPRQVIVTHHFVAGGQTSESERGLTVGGTGAVGVGVFEGFDYVALGHLHKRQTLGGGRIHYPGSALKYAFDETSQTKAVSIVELADDGPHIEPVSLGALRDVRRITGSFEQVLAAAPADERNEDYIEVVLDDKTMPPDARGRLEEHYPNLLSLTRAIEALSPDASHSEPLARQMEQMTDVELFERFFRYSTGEEMAAEQQAMLGELLEDMRRGEAR